MNLQAKSLKLKSSTKLSFHPLAKSLYKEIMSAYAMESSVYLMNIDTLLDGIDNLPLNSLYVINSDSNAYQIIGGCYSPLFNKDNILPNNTIIFRIESSIGYDIKNKSKEFIRKTSKRVESQFNRDVINFIFLDFLRSISIISLKKPGVMDKGLQKITRECNSEVWGALFGEKKSYFQQADLAKLLNVDTDTIRNHSK